MMTAEELRRRIVETVAANGGHLASSLGAVELARALAAAFDPFVDRVLWDVGHQAYAWKLLTGRAETFGTLRRLDGVGPFVNPEESAADAFVGGHAGNALAAALGLAAARDLSGGAERIVAVTGDASLANGETLEALTYWSAVPRKVILVVNDNAAEGAPWISEAFFGSLGLPYIGPVDGHDEAALADAFARAAASARGAVVHARTVKGKGWAPAEEDPQRWHGTGPFDPAAPRGAAAAKGEPTWSDLFGRALCELARADRRVCAVVAAMKSGTGLDAFAAEFPERFFDVGICEATAVTFAAGLAKAGLRPVVAVYSSFLQRAVDQIVHDVCIPKLPVVFAADRAGCVGPDGQTHHGMFDIAMLRCVPNLTIEQPCFPGDVRRMFKEALAAGTPWLIRYPRGAAKQTAARIDDGAPLQFWALGDQVEKANRVAEILAARGIDAGVKPVRRVKPLTAATREELFDIYEAGQRLVTFENGVTAGGFGDAVEADLKIGWGAEAFVRHGSVEELERRAGLSAGQLADEVERLFAADDGGGGPDGDLEEGE